MRCGGHGCDAEASQALEALRVSEERHRIIAENARDVIWAMGPDGSVRHVSPAVLSLRGYTVAEAMAQPMSETLTAGSLATARAYFVELLADVAAGRPPAPYRGELEYVCRDGGTVWCDVIACPILAEDGTLVELLGVSRDLSERKRHEAELVAAREASEAANRALQAANAELETAQRISHVGSWTFDVASGAVAWSPELYRIHGREPGSVQPHWSLGIPDGPLEETGARRDRLIARALETGEPWDIEYQIVRRDGLHRRLSGRGEVIRGSNGVIVGLHGTVMDITDLHEAREARARGLARRADYLARVEHVLRTDLSLITGWAAMLSESHDAMDCHGRRQAVESIRRNATALVSHVQSLLAESAETAEAATMEPVPVDLSRIVATAVQDYDGVQHAVAVTADGGVDVAVRGTVSAVDTVLRHLIENGLRHASARVEVLVRPVPARGAVDLLVRDDGRGIPSGIDLFEPFEAHGEHAGHGLGLHVVRTLVDAMGGEVRARDRGDGPGAEFAVRLQAAPDA